MNPRDRLPLPGDEAAIVGRSRPRGGSHLRTANDIRETDSDYYHRRALQEQSAAQKAIRPEAEEAHQKLAAMYRFRAMMSATAPPCWGRTSAHDAVREVA